MPNPNDPSEADEGGGGVAELTGETWMIAGPYSQGLALPPWVPASVVSDFDLNVASFVAAAQPAENCSITREPRRLLP